jgi:hypothetical protein
MLSEYITFIVRTKLYCSFTLFHIRDVTIKCGAVWVINLIAYTRKLWAVRFPASPVIHSLPVVWLLPEVLQQTGTNPQIFNT